MTNDNQFKPINKQFKEPNIPKTYEQFILEEQQNQSTEQDKKTINSYVEEVEACRSLGTQKGYGPSSYWSDDEGNYTRITTRIVREFRLIIKITGGTWWYYTDDKTAGIGGESSWWDSCNFFTKISQFGLGDQWRTDQMLVKKVRDARATLRALNNGTILVVNAIGCDSDNSRITKRNTIRNIERAIEAWENGENVDMNTTA